MPCGSSLICFAVLSRKPKNAFNYCITIDFFSVWLSSEPSDNCIATTPTLSAVFQRPSKHLLCMSINLFGSIRPEKSDIIYSFHLIMRLFRVFASLFS